SQPWLIGAGAGALTLTLVIAFSTSGGDDEETPQAGGDSAGVSGENGDARLINDEEFTGTDGEWYFAFNGGDTVHYTSGLAIMVSPAEALPSGTEPYGLDPGEVGYTFTVTIQNQGEKSVDVGFDPYLRATDSAVTEPDENSDDVVLPMTGDGFVTSLDGTVKPGESLTGAFACPVPADAAFLGVEYIPFDEVTHWNLELP
ncbi:hypothetical protein, partial [Streptomyces sp. 6N223]|uniref:hypothetical protein n=1 Tax=Streptomyces sp. 6N223 TaxID=3457412 RepID=UPI003FCEF35D